MEETTPLSKKVFEILEEEGSSNFDTILQRVKQVTHFLLSIKTDNLEIFWSKYLNNNIFHEGMDSSKIFVSG